MRRRMRRRRRIPPVLRGSVLQVATAAWVLESRSRFPLLRCRQLCGLWDRWQLPEGATLNNLKRKEACFHSYTLIITSSKTASDDSQL